MHSLYNTPHYNMGLIQHGHVVAPKYFNHGILQRNYRKMKWSFSYNSFVKLPLYNMIH